MRARILFVCLCSLLILCATSSGQITTCTIVGTVTDPTGAAVPNATVTITNSDKSQVVRTLQTGSDGTFTVPALVVGRYRVTVEAPGFSKFQQSDIDLNVGDRYSVAAQLKVGPTSETVNVEANPLQVETQNATQSGLITGTQVRELSLNARVYEQLVSLVPGVSYGGAGDQLYIGVSNPDSGQSNQVRFQINGARMSQNNWTVDGADNVDRGANLTLLTYPSVDSIAEFKVVKGDYTAESGRAVGGQINVVTRSGESNFHGSAYEFFRNDVLNANRYFNKPNLISPTANVKRSPLRYNNFGWNLGGPVYIPGHYNAEKNKTFFFFSEEWRRVITYTTAGPTMPTADELAGRFRDASGNPVNVCIAYAGPTNNTCTTTGSQITTIDPVAKAYINDIFSKLPLAPDTGHRTVFTPVNNLFNGRQEVLRLDHVFGPRLSVFGRMIRDSIPTAEPGALFQGTALPNAARTETNSPGHQYIGKGTVTFSPTFLMEAGYNYTYGGVFSNSVGLSARKNSPDINSAITFPFPVTVDHVPNLSGTGASGLFSFGPYDDFNRSHQVFGNMTKVRGAHTFKWGLSYLRYEKHENDASANAGTLSYASTQGQPTVGNTTFQRSWANFLLGRPASFTQLSQDITADPLSNQLEAFGQDEWRLRHNLTVTLGVRWEYYGEVHDGLNHLTNWIPRFYDPATAPQLQTTGANRGNLVVGTGSPTDGIIIGGQNSPWGDAVLPGNHLNFAPRAGIVWDPWGHGKTAIRTGYGMYYDNYSYQFAENDVFNNPPFVNKPSTPQTIATNPGAGGFSISSLPLTSLHGIPYPNHAPYTQQWSLGIQQEFGRGWFTDISYVGTKGTHLTGNMDLNMVPLGAAVAAGLFKPGEINTQSNNPLFNLVRPYKGFGPITVEETLFGSNYNSLQTQLQKRFGGSSLLTVSYTWSHGLTDAQSDSVAPMNTYNVHAEYGPLQFDRRHVFSASYVYEMPWLKEQRGLAGKALGGWELSGLITANTGVPLTVTMSGFDPGMQGILGASAAGARPFLVGNPNNGPRTILQWFNTSAFLVPSCTGTIGTNQVCTPPGGTPGTSGRGVVIGPGYWKWDASLFKNFKLTERAKVQFRAEFFNVLNHTNFGNPATTATTTSSFGQISSTRDPRVGQLALKFTF